jgi:hypothetical protein
MTFLRIFGRRIRLNDTGVEAVEESAALQDNFPETEGPQVMNVILTRMELQNLKHKRLAAIRCRDLLKKKSDALTLRFRSLLREIRDTKLQPCELTKDALFAGTEVRFVADDMRPTVIQSVSNIPQMLSMSIDNIAGIRVSDFTRTDSDNEQNANQLVGLSGGVSRSATRARSSTSCSTPSSGWRYCRRPSRSSMRCSRSRTGGSL